MSDFDLQDSMIGYSAYSQRANLAASQAASQAAALTAALTAAQATTQAVAQAASQAASHAAAHAAAQAESLNLQKKFGQDLTNIGSQQLSIGRQHLEAEASEQARKREQTEQIRQFRNLLVDASGELADFRKQHLA